MRLVIDRIEDGFAVIESPDGNITVPENELPTGASPGDILKKTPCGFEILHAETEERRKSMSERLKRLLGE